MAATKSRQFLSDAGFTESEIGIIATLIIEHSYSLGKKPSSIESMILQDADKLDALGAIGVMRTLSCGSQMRLSYYDIEDPFASKRDQNDKLFTIFLLNK